MNKVALGVLLVWAFMAGYALVESFGFFDKSPEQENLAFENALVSIGHGMTTDSAAHRVSSVQAVSLLLPVPCAQLQALANQFEYIPPVPSNALSSPSGSLFVLRI